MVTYIVITLLKGKVYNIEKVLEDDSDTQENIVKVFINKSPKLFTEFESLTTYRDFSYNKINEMREMTDTTSIILETMIIWGYIIWKIKLKKFQGKEIK